MSYFNRAYIIGRFTKDLELRTSKDGNKFVSFTLAVNQLPKKGEKESKAIFIDCTLDGIHAENAAKYCHKGDEILLEGVLSQRKYIDKKGIDRTVTGIHGYNCTFLKKKQDSNGADKAGNQPKSQGTEEEPDITDDDIPF